MTDKRGTTIRLGVSTRDLLKEASRILDRSQSDIAEEALKDWFKKNDFNGTYQLNLTASNAVLIRTGGSPRIIEVTERNGVSPQEVVDQYKKQLRAPVRLVIQEGDMGWPDKDKKQ